MKQIYLDELIKLSNKAIKTNNVPIAALIVKNNKIIAKAYNKKNTTNVSIDHAEILAIKKACEKLKTWRLNGCTMYVTLEPCNMCTAAIVESRIDKVIYLTNSTYKETEFNNKKKLIKQKATENQKYNQILADFFKKLR